MSFRQMHDRSDGNEGFNFTLHLFLWSVIAVLSVLYIFRPVADLDFWWHLKTGDIIVQQRELLKLDPFNFTGDVTVHGRQSLILNGYWLWQVTASLLFSAWGFAGIWLLKGVTLALLGCAVLWQMHRQRLSHRTIVLLVSSGLFITVNLYQLERPQVISLIFMTVLIGMISRIRMGYGPCRMAVPMMVLWANIHGGYVVGDLVLAIAAAGFLIQYRQDMQRMLALLGWSATAIFASFLNPSGWNVFAELLNFMQNSIGTYYVMDYRSIFRLYLDGVKMPAVLLCVLSALHLIGIFMVKRKFWPELLISIFIIMFGLRYVRNTGFIALSLLPMTGWYLEQAVLRIQSRVPVFLRVVCAIACGVLSVQAIDGEWQRRKNSFGFISNTFPVGMATFLKQSGISGRLFNDLDDGGYLNWALHPDWKTFIDSRELDTRVSKHWLQMKFGNTELITGTPLYQLLLDRYKIDVVGLKIALKGGQQLQPLLKLLVNSEAWQPIFLDSSTFVLVRETAFNSGAVEKYKMERTDFLHKILAMIRRSTERFPNDVAGKILYADILFYCGQVEDAEQIVSQLESAGVSHEMVQYLRTDVRFSQAVY